MAEAMALVQIGTDVSIEVVPFTVGAGGVPTYAASQTLTGKAERANERNRRLLDETSGLGHGMENYTPYKTSWDLQLDGIRYSDDNPIENVAATYAFAKVIITGPTSIRTYWGAIEEWANPTEKGKSVETLTLKPVYRGAGYANPEISAP